MSQNASFAGAPETPVKNEPETISLLYESKDSKSSPVVIDLTMDDDEDDAVEEEEVVVVSTTTTEKEQSDDVSDENSVCKHGENSASTSTTRHHHQQQKHQEQQHDDDDDEQNDTDENKGQKHPDLTSTKTPSTIVTGALGTGTASAIAIASSNSNDNNSNSSSKEPQQDLSSTARVLLKQPPPLPQQPEKQAFTGNSNNNNPKNTTPTPSLKMRHSAAAKTTLFWAPLRDSDDDDDDDDDDENDEHSSSCSPQDSSPPVVSTEDESQKSSTSTEDDNDAASAVAVSAAAAETKAMPPQESPLKDDSKQSASLLKPPPQQKSSMDDGQEELEIAVAASANEDSQDMDSSFELDDSPNNSVNAMITGTRYPRAGSKRKAAIRCQDCAGCREPVCGKCSYEAQSACCFRPCVNYAYLTLYNREASARNMARLMPHTYQDKYNRVYHDPAIMRAIANHEQAHKKPKLQLEVNDEASTATPPPQTFLSPPTTPRRQALARCNECVGCYQMRCGHCSSCVDHPASVDGCVFRPCLQQGVACLDNLRMAARTVAGQVPEQLEEAYNTVYGPYSAICVKLGTHAPISPKKLVATRLPSSSQNKHATRCMNCYGCLRRCCYRCDFCLARRFNSCAFRPCVQYKDKILENRRLFALQLARSLPDNFSALYETLYGTNGLVGERTKQEAALSSSVASLTEPVTESLGRRCGMCVNCLEPKCGKCEPCNQSSGPYQSCIYTLCRNFGYAGSTMRYYCKVAEAVTPCGGKEHLYESMYGINGWVRAGAGKAKTMAATGKKCMSCESCLKERCGICAGCTSKNYNCILRLCRDFGYARSTLETYNYMAAKWTPSDEESAALHEAMYGPKGWVTLELQKKSSGLSIGTRVYCIWPDNNEWYWGHIQGSRLQGKERLYDVKFEDGDERSDVRWNEFVTEDEYQPPTIEDRKRPARLTQCIGAGSSDLMVGSKCYAKYSNGQWYWGTVSAVSGSGRTRNFSIQFDDGDYLAGLAPYCIVSEEQYKQEFGDSDSSGEEKKYRTPSELQRCRCKECTLCVKEDCGVCQSCVTNQRQTSTTKDMCLMKMCLRIPVEEKQQPLSGLLKGFSYYVTDPEKLNKSINKKPAIHPDLQGLVILDKNGTRFRTLKDACKSVDMSADALREAEVNLYQRVLGRPMTEKVVDHQILGKGFHRRWQDCKGNVKEVYGTIIECQKNLLDGSLLFTVELFEECRKKLKAVAVLRQGVPKNLMGISAADAWGGFVSFMKKDKRESELNLMKLPFYLTYIVPGSRDVDRYTRDGIPVIVYHVDNHRLEIEARQSDIPNAGLGLWVKCTCIIPLSKRRFFELPRGHLIDLGVYAPLTAGDCKNENITLLKNFLFSWNCESWYWDSAMPSIGSVYDITDDHTGDLHETARKTPIVYANETDGHSQATIVSSTDPERSVHYYLGNLDTSLRLPTNGKPVELKIDYGPRYERVRVRKGYPRATGQELEIKRQQVEQDDHDTIREFHECSVTEILEAVDFLKPIFAGFLASDSEKIKLIERALIAALAMSGRLKEIRREFESLDNGDDSSSVCTNGYSTLEENQVESKLASLIAHLCSLFPCGSNQLHAQLVADGMYQMVLIQSLGMESIEELKSLSPGELRGRIESVMTTDD